MRMRRTKPQFDWLLGSRRVESGDIRDCLPRSVDLFRVRLDVNGCDDGGAYHGLSDIALYCARDGDGYQQFVSADNRRDAAAILEIPSLALRSRLTVKELQPWSVTWEYCGQSLPRHVVRWFDAYIEPFDSAHDAVNFILLKTREEMQL